MRRVRRKHTRSSNGQRTSDATEFLVGDERGVSSVADVKLAVPQEAANVLATEAVANTSNTLNTQVFSEELNGALDNGVDTTGLVVGEPLREVDLAGLHVADLDGVAVEEVGDDGQVAIVGVLVGKEFAVDEETEDVGEDDDGFIRVLVVLGVGDVGVDYELKSVIGHGANSRAMGHLPPAMFFTSPTGVPSCLKPVAQQAPGGLEAILKDMEV